jgi:hypothetical protein
MTVTRDVIRDLWPLYESGEATTDTCALVERYLDDDAELARELASQRGLKTLLAYPLPPDLDREMLVKARRRLWRSDLLHKLAIGAFFLFVVVGEIPGGFEKVVGWLARAVQRAPFHRAPAVTGYRVLPDGRRLDVIRLEQRLPFDPLILHYYSDASGCALDSEAESAREALGPEIGDARPRSLSVNAYDRDGTHVLTTTFEPDRRDGLWYRVDGGVPGCPATEAAIARRPDRYRQDLKRRYER